MYYCTECEKTFEKLVQFQKDDKMFQLCPHCKSEEIKLLTDISESDKIRFLRKNKLDRILKEKIIMTKKTL